MSTSWLWQPMAAMTASASERDSGDEVRYGSITHSRLSAPIDSASEIRHQRRVEAARQGEDHPLEAGLVEVAADELTDDLARHAGIDEQLGRQDVWRVGRRRCFRHLVGEPHHFVGVLAWLPGAWRLVGRRLARPLANLPLQLAAGPSPAARRATAAAPRARGERRRGRSRSTKRPSSSSGASKLTVPAGSRTCEPPQNVTASSTPTRLTKTTKQVVSCA